MNKALRNSLMATWMGCMGLGMVAKADESTAKPKFSVCVLNYAHVPSSTLREAEKVAKGIFERAGVETTWTDFEPPSTSEVPSMAGKIPCASTLLMMHVNLVGDPKSFARADNTLGMAPGNSGNGERSLVYVFEQVADEMIQQQHIADRSDILGHAMAHEIGHILSRIENHSPTGLMRANWQREDFQAMVRRRLNFDCGQAARIREEVARRARQQAISQLAANSQ
jgi:hypothetical protein